MGAKAIKKQDKIIIDEAKGLEFNSEDELYQLNLEGYLYRDGVTLIEWADRALSLLPTERLEVYFEVLGPKERKIEIKEINLESNLMKALKK